MTSTKPIQGTILNKLDVTDKKTGQVAASTTLAIGCVYQDGSNGWKNVPTDASILGKDIYWNEKSIDNSSGAKGDKSGTFYGEGSLVVGKADGAIVIDSWCKPSTNNANELMALSDPAATLDATYGGGTTVTAQINEITTWQKSKTAIYKGHALETNRMDTLATDAVDDDVDCVFLIKRGG